MKKHVFGVAIGLVCIFVASVNAYACSCRQPEYGETLSNQIKAAKSEAEAIFSGRVTKISEQIEFEYVRVEFEVANVWKGAVKKNVMLLTGLHDGNCRFRFESGKVYLIYANSSSMYTDSRELNTDMCHRTKLLVEGKGELRFLGRKRKPHAN